MRLSSKILIPLSLATMLTACVTKPPQATQPIVYKAAVSGATQQSTPMDLSSKPEVKTIQPLQTDITIPYKTAKPLTGISAIKAANKKALREPVSSGYVNSIMTFNYMPGALYEIYCAPLTVSDIQLQEGEKIVAVAAGDTLRWQVSKTFSGNEATRVEHLLVKPTDKDLTNSLVITTDQRTYHLLLRSTAATYMPTVKWHYAEGDIITALSPSNDQEAAQNLNALAQGLDVNHLDFNYKTQLTKGPRPEWYPTLVFNDGNKTYIRLPRKIQEAPTLFIGSSVKDGQIVNYRTVGNYYIVDSLFPEAQLRAGQGNQIIVQISYVRK